MHKTEVAIQDGSSRAYLEMFHSPSDCSGIRATLHYLGPIRWEEPPACSFTRERVRLALLRKALDAAVALPEQGVPLLQLDARWQDADEKALLQRYLRESLSKRFTPSKACEPRAGKSAAATAGFLGGFQFAS